MKDQSYSDDIKCHLHPLKSEPHFRLIERHITTNIPFGLTIYHHSQILSPQLMLPDGMRITFCYDNSGIFPIKGNDKDLLLYNDLIENPPGIDIPH